MGCNGCKVLSVHGWKDVGPGHADAETVEGRPSRKETWEEASSPSKGRISQEARATQSSFSASAEPDRTRPGTTESETEKRTRTPSRPSLQDVPGGSGGNLAVYRRASASAAAFLASQVHDRRWLPQDLAYCSKIPLALLQAGREEDAILALELFASFAAADAGLPQVGEATNANAFPQLPYLWICWAATLLGRQELAAQSFEVLRCFQHPLTDSGVTRAPFPKGKQVTTLADVESDFFATALLLKGALLCGRLDLAAPAADSLLRALDANRLNVQLRRFNLRWRWGTGFMEETSPELCVVQDMPDQLYSTLGFAALGLLELASADGANPSEAVRHNAAAADLLEFLRGCQGLVGSRHSHAAAAAFAAVYDRGMAKMLADGLISNQQICWLAQELQVEGGEMLDLVAETVIWFAEVERHLADL